MRNWYIESIEDTLSAFSVNADSGLSDEQAQHYLSNHGKNKLREKEPPTLGERFLSQLKNPLTVILIIAAFVSLVVEIVEAHGKPINFAVPLIIISAVILSAVLRVVLEQKCEAALDALRKTHTPRSEVRRDGKARLIPTEEIVPGDIVLLKAGDIIPADGRIITCTDFKCSEAVLTGSSELSEKDADARIDVTCPLSDRINMVFSGCSAVSGRAEFVVTSTAMNTEMGSIAGMLAHEDDELTPLQKRLAKLCRTVCIAAVIACALIFILGSYVTKDWLNVFTTAASLAVFAIPEVLAATCTVIFALGISNMAKKNAVVRKLTAAETLGTTSVICSDKTGTLTHSDMSLERGWSYESNALRNISDLENGSDASIVKLIQLAALCSNAWKSRNQDLDPVDAAVISALTRLGQEKTELESAYKRIDSLPFDHERRLMTTVHSTDSGLISITKGTPDIILSRCRNVDSAKVTAVYESFGRDSLKVIAVACKRLPKSPDITADTLENDLTFIGLLGISAPPKDEARLASKVCREAGIRTVMITGDHIVTACAAAKELGILSEGEEAITGEELTSLSDKELYSNIRKYSVYSGITPTDRLRVINAWQVAGESVAVTGISVNDAPALVAADTGCALGAAGTDVARNAADIILTDNNYASIVSAVREGRGISENLRRAVRFLISCCFGEIAALFICLLIFKALPLSAVHLMPINLVCAILPAFALSCEPSENHVMKRAPRPKDDGILNRRDIIQTIIQGVVTAAVTVIAYAVGMALSDGNTACASAMTFGVLSLSLLTTVLTVRTEGTVFSRSFILNKIMLYALGIAVAVILIAMVIPPVYGLFSFTALSAPMWLWTVILSLVPILAGEVCKLFERLYSKYTS